MSDIAWQADMAHLIEERIGVRLRLDEPGALENFVSARLRALNLTRPGSYVNFLRAEPQDGPEFSRLTAVCTNGQTYFYRDEAQLRAAVEAVRQCFAAHKRPVWIWSAGCSTGEEPYSMALLLYQTGLPAYIVATDINKEALASAQKAIYGAWALRNITAEVRERFFVQQEDRFILCDKVRNMVEFRPHNLVTDPMPTPHADPGGWDIILCRNVFIYYAEPTAAGVLTRMAQALRAEGWVFIGASETVPDRAIPLRLESVAGRTGLRQGPVSVPGPPPAAAILEVHAPGMQPPDTERYREATALLDAGKREAATSILRGITTANPQHVPSWLLLGHVALHQHDFEAALEAYVQAQAREPLLAEVHYFQGLVHRKVGNLEQAEQALQRTLFLEPDYWPAAYLLAGIYDRQGRSSLSRHQLMHTQNSIRAHPAIPFRSYIAFNPVLRLSAAEVMTACAQRLFAARR